MKGSSSHTTLSQFHAHAPLFLAAGVPLVGCPLFAGRFGSQSMHPVESLLASCTTGLGIVQHCDPASYERDEAWW